MKLSLPATLVACALLVAPPAWSQIRVGVISSATGPSAEIGIPQKNTVALLPRWIGDLTVEYIAYDDASDPGQTISLFKKLIGEHRVDAIIGPSTAPGAMAVLSLVADGGVPLLTPVGASAVVLPMDEQKRWVFKTAQNDSLLAEALVAHMKKTGMRTIGFIGLADDPGDSSGDNWLQEFSARAQAAGLALAVVERYRRADQAVSGQINKLIAARPDAVLIAGTGSSALLPHISLIDQGYKGAIYQTSSAATPDFIRLGGKKVDGAFMAGSLMLGIKEISDANPSRRLAQGYITTYEKLHGAKAATFGASIYDAGLLLQRVIPEALKRSRPGTAEFRAALRDALEQTKEFVVTQGVYTLSPADHAGFDKRGVLMMTVRDHGWRLIGE